MNVDIRYSIIIPVFNEEAVIAQTYQRLKQVMEAIGEPFELVFVNDGSIDRSTAIIKSICDRDESVKLISFSRNFGHQIAITAGMDYSSGAAVIIIDADLQDPPELIPELIAKWKEGYEVVYAKRIQRKGETFLKKQSANLFYRVLRASADIDIPVDTGDFRLMDRKVCNAMKRLPEKNRYVRGLVSWVGFRQTALEYERDRRLAGEPKYSLKKMFKLSIDAFTSFSFKPLRIASYSGALLILPGLIYLVFLLLFRLHEGYITAALNFVIAFQMLLAGFLLTMLGIMGEYIGRIYDEVRDRPLYIIREYYGKKNENDESERNGQF